MADQTLTAELTRLRKEQAKARQDEVYGGQTAAERAEYYLKSDRIKQLEKESGTAEIWQIAA